MNESKSYARIDSLGVHRIADTRVMLDSVVLAFRQGHSPETIQQQYPSLSLEGVYGSIAYYLAAFWPAERFRHLILKFQNTNEYQKSTTNSQTCGIG